jgi:hypothetical protein
MYVDGAVGLGNGGRDSGGLLGVESEGTCSCCVERGAGGA